VIIIALKTKITRVEIDKKISGKNDFNSSISIFVSVL
jgi:hypothetical protein